MPRNTLKADTVGVEINGKNISNFSCVDGTSLLVEISNDLKLLIDIEESENIRSFEY